MVQAIPEGVSSVVPYLCIRGATKAIEFYKAAFGAEVMSLMPMGDQIAHADLKIGGARVYLADEMPAFGAVKSPKTLKGTSANIHLWTEDCEAAFARAVEAGAKVLMPLTDQFWGDRFGMVADPFGHVWAISSQKEELTPEEMTKRSAEAMAQMEKTPPAAAPKRKKARKPKGKAKSSSVAPPPPPAAKAVRKDKAAKKSKAVKKDKATKKSKAGKKDKSKKAKKDKKRKKKSKR